MRFRVQFAGALDKRYDLVFMQQRLATRNGKTIELRPCSVRSVELGDDIALVRKEILVVILIRIKAKIAVPRAAQVNEKRCRALAGATRQARRRYPAAPQGRVPVFAMTPTRSGNLHTARSRTRLRSFKGNAKRSNCVLVVAFYLVECFRVFPNVHQNPYSLIRSMSQSSCTAST